MANKLNFIVDVDSKGAQSSFANLKTGATGSASAMLAAFNPVTAALAAAAAAAVAIGAGLKKSVQVASEFEASMAEVSTLLDTNVVSMEALKKQVMALPNALGSTNELAKALYQVNSAGFAGKEGIDVLTTSAKAAKAGVTDAFTAVDAITTVMENYGISAENSSIASDQLFTTVKLGKTKFEELAKSIGRVAPLASKFGVTSEELLGSVAELTKSGSASSEAMTQLKAAISNIIKPGKTAFETADALGLQFDAAALKAKGLSGVLADVVEKTRGNEDAIKELFPSVEALNAVSKLASDQGLAGLKESMDAIKNSGGATDTAFKKQTSTYKSAQEELDTAFEKLGITIGDKILPGLTAMTKAVAEFVSSSNTLDTVSNIFDTIGVAIKIVVEAWKLLFNLLKIFSPVLNVAVAGFKALVDILPSTESASGGVLGVFESILAVMEKLNGFLEKVADWFRELFIVMGKLTFAAVTGDMEEFADALGKIKQAFEPVIKFFEQFTGFLDDVGVKTKETVKNIYKAISFKSGAAEFAKGITDNAKVTKGELWDLIKFTNELRDAQLEQIEVLKAQDTDTSENVKALMEKTRKTLQDELDRKGFKIDIDFDFKKLDADDTLDDIRELIEKMNEQNINFVFTGEGSSKLPLGEKIKEIIGWMTGLTGEIDKEKPEMNIGFKDGEGKPISKSLDIIKDGFSSFFGDVIKGTMSVEDGFKNMAASILQSIGDMLASQAVNGLVSLLGDSIGSLFTGTGADIPAMADGGVARGGKPHLVGERGPELFVPGQTGTVIPNGMGGGGVNVINNITVNSSGGAGGDEKEDKKLGKILGEMITDKVKETLATEKRPGGMLNPASAVGRG